VKEPKSHTVTGWIGNQIDRCSVRPKALSLKGPIRCYIINAYIVTINTQKPVLITFEEILQSVLNFIISSGFPWVIDGRLSQSLFFECLASLDHRPKQVLLLAWGV
jgi:hypothetical protein